MSFNGLHAAEFRLLLVHIEPLYDKRVFERGLYLVPSFRRAEALRWCHAKDRCLSLAAGLLLALAAQEAGLALETLLFSKSPYGKLFCETRSDWHFNLSQSGSLAVCLSGPCPTGVDVQALGEIPHCFVDVVLHASEKEWLAHSGKENQRTNMARLWTRKEAFLKAVGVGFSVNPVAVSVLPGCDPVWQGKHYHFTEYTIAEHILTACLPQNRAFPALQQMSMTDVISRLSVARTTTDRLRRSDP